MLPSPREWYVSQFIALFLVVFGSLCIGVGSHSDWAELKTAGAGIIGAGIQAITSQIKQSLTNRDGGTINVEQTKEAP